MRLQDLKDDLAEHFCNGANNICGVCAAARRVADLYDECPDCGGTLRVKGDGYSTPCHRCQFGVIPSERLEAMLHGDAEDGVFCAWDDLTAYLFGESR